MSKFWDVDAAIREWAVVHHGLITYERALALGATPSYLKRRCQSRAMVRLARRIYLVTALLDDYSHLAAACLSRPGTVASHRAAAWLLGLDGVDAHVVEVSVPYGRGPRGAVVHRTADLLPHDVTRVKGIPCTNATRVLCDAGAMVDANSLEHMLESALRLGLTRVPRIEWRLNELARPGRTGPSVLRDVLARRPAGEKPTESWLETRYTQVLREHNVPLPVRQFEVRDANGVVIARLDNAYPDVYVWVELDGKGAHGPSRFQRDRSRQNDVVLAGWRPLRFTYHDVVERGAKTAADTRAALAMGTRLHAS